MWRKILQYIDCVSHILRRYIYSRRFGKSGVFGKAKNAVPKQGRNKVYEIRDHSPGIWEHNTWDRDQQCFSGIRDQNCERFWDQGSKFPMFLWSGIKILNVFVIRDQNLGQKYRISYEKIYLVTTLPKPSHIKGRYKKSCIAPKLVDQTGRSSVESDKYSLDYRINIASGLWKFCVKKGLLELTLNRLRSSIVEVKSALPVPLFWLFLSVFFLRVLKCSCYIFL